MKKALALGVVLAVFTSTSYADNQQPKFIAGLGFSAGTGTYEVTAKVGNASHTEEADLDSTSGNIHLGFMLRNNNRVLLGLESITMKDDADDKFKASGVRLDWQFVYGSHQIQPYWGVGLGVYSSDDLAEAAGESSLNGVSFQLMGGVKFVASEQIEVDFNIQGQGISWQDLEYTNGYSSATIEQTTSNVSLGLGVDFKF